MEWHQFIKKMFGGAMKKIYFWSFLLFVLFSIYWGYIYLSIRTERIVTRLFVSTEFEQIVYLTLPAGNYVVNLCSSLHDTYVTNIAEPIDFGYIMINNSCKINMIGSKTNINLSRQSNVSIHIKPNQYSDRYKFINLKASF